jgi:hypothetical protein
MASLGVFSLIGRLKEIAKQQVFETKQRLAARVSERGDSAPGYTKSGSGFFESGV